MHMDRMQMIALARRVHLSRHAMRSNVGLALTLLAWERPPMEEIVRILKDAVIAHAEGEEAMQDLLRPERAHHRVMDMAYNMLAEDLRA